MAWNLPHWNHSMWNIFCYLSLSFSHIDQLRNSYQVGNDHSLRVIYANGMDTHYQTEPHILAGKLFWAPGWIIRGFMSKSKISYCFYNYFILIDTVQYVWSIGCKLSTWWMLMCYILHSTPRTRFPCKWFFHQEFLYCMLCQRPCSLKS